MPRVIREVLASQEPFANHEKCADYIEQVRIGKRPDMIDGKPKIISVPKHEVEQDVIDIVLWHLRSGGILFQSARPYYFCKREHRLYDLTTDVDAYLAKLRLHKGSPLHTQVAASVRLAAKEAPERTLHKLSYFNKKALTVYIYTSPTTMVRVREFEIETVPLGTDDVILMAPDTRPWPTLDELRPYMDEMRSVLGQSCAEPRPGLPMTDLVTTRWGRAGHLTPYQAQRVFMQRWLFLYFASAYAEVWPFLFLTGETGSGKSTLLELWGAALHGIFIRLKSLPKPQDLGTALASASLLFWDNVDRGFDSNAKKDPQFLDTVCQIATGGVATKRVLYSDGDEHQTDLLNHVAFTSINMPFAAEDIQRRVIHLTIEMIRSGNRAEDDKIDRIERTIEARPRILAELLLRIQNGIRAHREQFPNQPTVTRMAAYERFTHRLAQLEDRYIECRDVWGAIVERYGENIRADNPVYKGIAMWLASNPENLGRKTQSTVLCAEIQSLYETLRLPWAYQNPISLGRAISHNRSALDALGMVKYPPQQGREYYRFVVGEDEMHQFREELKGYAEAKARHVPSYMDTPVSKLAAKLNKALDATPKTPMSFDDVEELS